MPPFSCAFALDFDLEVSSNATIREINNSILRPGGGLLRKKVCAHALDPATICQRPSISVYALYLGMISATSIASLPSGQYYARKVPQLRLVGGRFSSAERPAGIRSWPQARCTLQRKDLSVLVSNKNNEEPSPRRTFGKAVCVRFSRVSQGVRVGALV